MELEAAGWRLAASRAACLTSAVDWGAEDSALHQG